MVLAEGSVSLLENAHMLDGCWLEFRAYFVGVNGNSQSVVCMYEQLLHRLSLN